MHPFGILRVKSGQRIYLAGGAMLRARILGPGVEDVVISGRGILDGSTVLGRHSRPVRRELGLEPMDLKRALFVDYLDSRGIGIEGIHLIDAPSWTLRFHECRDSALTPASARLQAQV